RGRGPLGRDDHLSDGAPSPSAPERAPEGGGGTLHLDRARGDDRRCLCPSDGPSSRSSLSRRSQRLRVLFLNPIGQLGGAERILLDLVRSLREHEASLEISVLTLAEGPLVRAVSELGFDIRVVRLPRAQARLGDSGLGLGTLADLARSAVAGPAFAQFLHRLRREIRALRPDIVHSNGLKSHVLGAWLRPRGSSLIWHLHDF